MDSMRLKKKKNDQNRNHFLYSIVIVIQGEFHLWMKLDDKVLILITLLKSCSMNLLIRNHGMSRCYRRWIHLFFFYFCHFIFVSAVYNNNVMIDESKTFNWNFFCQLVFFLIPYPRVLKKLKFRQVFYKQTLCRKNVSHLALSCLL